MSDDSPQACRFCGARGPHSAIDACYGCVQMATLTYKLTSHRAELTRLIEQLDNVQDFAMLAFLIEELHIQLEAVNDIVASLDRYSNA